MQLAEILERSLSRPVAATRASEAFLDSHRTKPRFAIGKNAEALAIHRLVPLDGIIDDYAAPGETWRNISLIRTVDAPKDASVVNCSTSIRPVDTLDHLYASGFRNVAGIPDLVRSAGGALAWPDFVEAQRRELQVHIDAWQTIHDRLADDASRQVLRDVLLFRLTADAEHMRGYTVRVMEQYFEPFMEYGREVFVDAGGFDGDTSEAFAARYPDYRKIFLFEPSAHNIARARERLAGLRDVAFFPIGLSRAPGRLRFDPGAGSASAVSSFGSDEIVVDTLDAVVSEPVSFVKMDLEGWELPALEGASGHIRSDRPKLAIAVYHGAADLRLIHEFVHSFDHDYRVFLRHYTQGWSETVLFFTR